MDHHKTDDNNDDTLKKFIISLEKDKNNVDLINTIQVYVQNIYDTKSYKPTPEFEAWLQQEVTNKNSSAQLIYGALHPDEKQSFKLLQLSSDQDNWLAKHWLANRYWIGICDFLDADNNKAFNLYKPCADFGILDACVDVGLMYRKGEGTQTDYDMALKYYQKAADKGNPRGQAYLGVCYECGYGVNEDPIKALQLYHLSAAQGLSEGAFYVGEMYENGTGVDRDMDEALKWYNIAAEKQNDDACYRLGVMYYRGNVPQIKQDDKKAADMFLIAAKDGHDEACTRMAMMYIQGKGVDKDYKKAFQMYSNGHMKAMKQPAHKVFYNLMTYACHVMRDDEFIKDIFTKWNENDELKKNLAKLEEENEILRTEVAYQPGGEGYKKAKEDAEQLFDLLSTK